MNRVTHFEIPSDDPQKAMKFYSDTLAGRTTSLAIRNIG